MTSLPLARPARRRATRRPLLSAVALLLLALAPATSGAQATPGQDARLAARLDPRTRGAVERVIDSARALRLPTEPLVDKALEGASKRADGERIVTAVRTRIAELAAARTALGGSASTVEIVAGADAIHAGVGPEGLARLRRERPRGDIVVPLGVLSQLIARGVPPDSASSTVIKLAGAGVADEQLVAFRRDVERDISVGAPPATAMGLRASAALFRPPPGSGSNIPAPPRRP